MLLISTARIRMSTAPAAATRCEACRHCASSLTWCSVIQTEAFGAAWLTCFRRIPMTQPALSCERPSCRQCCAISTAFSRMAPPRKSATNRGRPPVHSRRRENSPDEHTSHQCCGRSRLLPDGEHSKSRWSSDCADEVASR